MAKSTTERIAEAFEPRAVPADQPGQPMRAHHMQVPSDRLRDHAREFCRIAVALVPDLEFHDLVVDLMHDVVVLGERRLERVLETREDFKGHKLGCTHPGFRTEAFQLVEEELIDDGQEEEPEANAGAEQPTGGEQPAGP